MIWIFFDEHQHKNIRVLKSQLRYQMRLSPAAWHPVRLLRGPLPAAALCHTPSCSGRAGLCVGSFGRGWGWLNPYSCSKNGWAGAGVECVYNFSKPHTEGGQKPAICKGIARYYFCTLHAHGTQSYPQICHLFSTHPSVWTNSAQKDFPEIIWWFDKVDRPIFRSM